MVLRAVFLFLLFLFAVQSATAKTLSVRGDEVNLRTGPGVGYDVEWAYGNGFPLQVLDRKGEWIKVRDFEHDTGWIHASLVSDEHFVIVNSHKNSDKTINIRSGPATSYDVIGEAYYGVVFQKLDAKSGWVRVRHESGLEGWVKATLLWGD